MALHVALVGAGQVARVHLRALSDANGVELVGIFDQDQERARDAAALVQAAGLRV